LSQPTSNNRKIRYGIIGFGGFAEITIAPAIRATPNSELVAIQKRSIIAAQQKAAQYSVPLAFDSPEQLASHPDVDAVFIVGTNAARCSETLAAAKAGKHAIVEKPMAMNAAECSTMIEACKKANVKMAVAHMLRYSPLIRRMREIIQSGIIGRPTGVRAEFVYDASATQRTWLFDMKLSGGGPVFDIGIHCLDSMRFILDDEVIVTKSVLSPYPTEIKTEMSASLSLQFSKGTVGSIYCSFETPLGRTFLEVMGSQGAVSAFGFTTGSTVSQLTVTYCKDRQIWKKENEDIAVPNLYVEEVTDFSESILQNREPFLTGESALQNQIVLDAAMKQL
jgi:predicted dehydrogenase